MEQEEDVEPPFVLYWPALQEYGVVELSVAHGRLEVKYEGKGALQPEEVQT